MSLLSNRGRFSHDDNNGNLNNEDIGLSSMLSSIGKNPIKLFKIENKIKKEPIKESKLKIPENFYDNKFISKHQEYNEKINKLYNENNEKQDSKKTAYNAKKKKINISLIISLIVIELLTIFAIAGIGTFIRLSNMTQKITFDKKAVQNTNIDESTLAVMKGYKTVAIFGVDSRTGSVDKGNNADVNIIANLNLETGDAQLVSIYRDLYLSVTDQNNYDKLNSAYRKGGPESAVKAINKNLDLNIENFFSFNWKAVADGIELLGGIDLNITKSEYKYMNAFIHETCIATGIDSKNPAAHYIKSAGDQHLDGVQAVAYGRLRLMDSDFQRVERQKKVIELCLEKAKELDIPRLRLIMEAVLPQIAYEFDMNEMLSILKIIKNIHITASCGVPETNNIVTMDMGGSGDCVVPLSLEKAVIILHKVLYNEEAYEPSLAVRRYSNRIIELKNKYAEENKIKASKKASEEEESRLKEAKPIRSSRSTVSKLKKKSATKSDIDEEIKTNPNFDIDDREVVPDIDYEEEPEEDEINNDNDENENENENENDDEKIGENGNENNTQVRRLAPGEEDTQETTKKITEKPNEGMNSAPSSSPVSSPVSSPAPINTPGSTNTPGATNTPGSTNTSGSTNTPAPNNTGKGMVVPGPPGSDSPNTPNTSNAGPVTSAPYFEPQ